MFSFLEPRKAHRSIPQDKVQVAYKRMRIQALLGIFLGYMAYYFVRNNFALSTPYIKATLELSNTEIGFLSSCLLIAYGISKGIMSGIADKADPGRYLIFGLLICIIINIFLGFSTALWMFVVLITLNGLFQGMGAGPCFITITNWYPHKERGIVGAIWNVSHNLGGGLVASIVAFGFFIVGPQHWQLASYQVPAIAALAVCAVIFFLCKGNPVNEGLPRLDKIVPEEAKYLLEKRTEDNPTKNMSAWAIFKKYVLWNKGAWLVSWMDAFVYCIRFGMISWLPLYLLNVKGFSKQDMAFAFLVFEVAAIPTTLFAGYISDKLFKGYRMPPAIISLVLIFFGILGYWQSTSIQWTIFFAAMVGCLIYVPQFLASVQTMEVVPSYAVGSAVGLRGFMSYIVGATLGTSLFGIAVDYFGGWHAGFMVLEAAVLLCIITCTWIHFFVKRRIQSNLEQEPQAEELQAVLAE